MIHLCNHSLLDLIAPAGFKDDMATQQWHTALPDAAQVLQALLQEIPVAP
jgi:hypothetical protein